MDKQPISEDKFHEIETEGYEWGDEYFTDPSECLDHIKSNIDADKEGWTVEVKINLCKKINPLKGICFDSFIEWVEDRTDFYLNEGEWTLEESCHNPQLSQAFKDLKSAFEHFFKLYEHLTPFLTSTSKSVIVQVNLED